MLELSVDLVGGMQIPKGAIRVDLGNFAGRMTEQIGIAHSGRESLPQELVGKVPLTKSEIGQRQSREDALIARREQLPIVCGSFRGAIGCQEYTRETDPCIGKLRHPVEDIPEQGFGIAKASLGRKLFSPVLFGPQVMRCDFKSLLPDPFFGTVIFVAEDCQAGERDENQSVKRGEAPQKPRLIHTEVAGSPRGKSGGTSYGKDTEPRQREIHAMLNGHIEDRKDAGCRGEAEPEGKCGKPESG